MPVIKDKKINKKQSKKHDIIKSEKEAISACAKALRNGSSLAGKMMSSLKKK